MEVFKKEIHAEISEIYESLSPLRLSNAIHITEGAFERMKTDPDFKNNIMNILREDVRASYMMPHIKCHATTTIDENGYSAYGANVYPHDSAETKTDKKTEGAFYYSSNCERESSQKKVDFDEIWLRNKEKQDLLKRTQRNRSLLQHI